MNQELSNKKLIRVDEIHLKIEEPETVLPEKIATILGIPKSEIIDYEVIKRAVDSRDVKKVHFVYSVDVKLSDAEKFFLEISLRDKATVVRYRVRLQLPYEHEIDKIFSNEKRPRPIIIGTGPGGMFAGLLLAKSGLNPIVVDQGKKVEERIKDVEEFFVTGVLNKNSNIQFGEGGAGTFSDGKLNTSKDSPWKRFILEEFVEAGAPPEILIEAQPHIGTDELRKIIINIRQKIIDLGGEVRFETCLTDLEIRDGKLVAGIFNGNERIEADELVLAIGHSARDTYKMLYENKLDIKSKPFSMGVRIEHTAEMINRSRYGSFYKNPKLPTARYQLVAHLKQNRSVYSFCMCPGGMVVAAATEEGRLVTNGMSERAQDGQNSNSALLVNVFPKDYGSDHPLAGVEFQRHWEEKSYQAGGGNYKAPAQLVGDFLAHRPSVERKNASAGCKNIVPTYDRGVSMTTLDGCLPDYILASLREALPVFNQKIKGFMSPEALLIGTETRSSSPVKIMRDANFESNIKGIYPAAEGSGYAGGIMSAGIDGLIVAEAVIKKRKEARNL
ncbi:MAG: putative FAD-dependent dehydrogenase [Chlamydiales bacterium]|jgi:uncharacterized FAD-dependent dehydrogenase